MKRFSGVVVCVVSLAAAACGDASPTAPVDRGADLAPSVSATEPDDVDDREAVSRPSMLEDPDLSAVVSIQGVHEAPSRFVRRFEGSGTLSGPDSMVRIEESFAGTSTVMFPNGRVLGAGGATSRVQESRRVDGVLFTAVDGVRWERERREDRDTMLGYLFHVLREVDAWVPVPDAAGQESSVRFEPASPSTVDASYFDVAGPTQTDALPASLVVAVDAMGTPTSIELEIDNVHPGVGSAKFEAVFTLDQVGRPQTVKEPADAWVWTSTLGPQLTWFDLLVPDDWTLHEDEEDFFSLRTPEDHYLIVEGANLDVDGPSQAMDQWAQAWEGDVVEGLPVADATKHPTAVAVVRFPDDRTGLARTSVFGPSVAALMLLAPEDIDRQALLDQVAGSLTWRHDDPTTRLVPGDTITDTTLQRDVLAVVLPAASEEGCADPVVVHTEFVAGTREGWTEEWYVQACGSLGSAGIQFGFGPDGVGYAVGLPLDPIGDAG